jgi:hypothetical protein
MSQMIRGCNTDIRNMFLSDILLRQGHILCSQILLLANLHQIKTRNGCDISNNKNDKHKPYSGKNQMMTR